MTTALDVQVLSAALKGKHGVNPPLSLQVEAQVRLLRGCDGAELYAVPVHYRSCERKFTEWAANDARLFREELEQCYRELSRAIADECVSRQLIPANQKTSPVQVATTK